MPQSPIFNDTDRSPRLGLPFLFPAQAHKEVTVNEALDKIDVMIAPVIEGTAASPDSLTPARGQCWLVAQEPLAEWAGCQNHIACWSGTNWAFHMPVEGQQIFDRSVDCIVFFREAQWRYYNAPEAVIGGGVRDEEARTAISALVARLTEVGILHPVP